MRKILAVLLSMVILFSLVGCKPNGDDNVNPADDWPKRSVEVIIPVNPGGGTDNSCRVMLPYLKDILGVDFAPINMSGASGSVGATEVAEAEADGYTLLYQQSDLIACSRSGIVDYEWYDEFKIAGVVHSISNMALMVAADAPYDDLKGFIEYAKKQDKPLSIASETGTDNHLFMLHFADQAGIELNFVDLGGAGNRVAAMKGKQIDMTCMPYANIKSFVATNDVKCIGIFADERNEFYPDLPTMKEQGLDDVTYNKFHLFAFPKDTPDEIVDKFSNALKTVCENPAFVEEIGSKLGFTIDYKNREDSMKFMMEVDAMYKPLADKFFKK